MADLIEINGASEAVVGPLREALKAAAKDSPAFTGTPTAPTAAPGTNTLQLATCAFVLSAIAALVDSSPGALDTLNELAAALGDDPNFATTMTAALAGKQPSDATLTALAGVGTSANKLIYATGVDTFSTTDLTAFARGLLDDADAAAALATLGLVFANQAEAEAGTDTTKLMTPERVAQAIAALGGGGGGLANFVSALASAAPNAAIPVASLIATNAAAIVDAVFGPKGTGAIAAQVADSASTGGNKRGQQSTDWQRERNAATQVASGDSAVLAGGRRNTASGATSFVGGGFQNVASGINSSVGGGQSNNAAGGQSAIAGGGSNSTSNNYTSIGGGQSNTASADHASVGGGSSNTASGAASSIGGGGSNQATGQYSSIPGGYQANTRGIYGAMARASGGLNGSGTTQVVAYILRRQTTDGTTTELSADGAAPGAATRVVLPNNHAYVFRGQAIARSTGGDVKAWEFKGVIKRGANAASTTLLSSTLATVWEDAGATTWVLALSADITNGSLQLQVTGAAATTIRWGAEIETFEMG